jgi:hypothetical protein
VGDDDTDASEIKPIPRETVAKLRHSLPRERGSESLTGSGAPEKTPPKPPASDKKDR